MLPTPNLSFDEDFFKSEYREDFLVDSTMKTVWAAEMELLSDIDAVCQKYNLQWYAYWGTLLGAIRHNGYIPWDDDIDIVMKRADYNKLMEVLPHELPDTYRVNWALGPNGHNLFWGCVMNADTISIEPDRLNKFHGCPFYVGIDIVPLDYVPDDPAVASDIHTLMTAIWKAVHVAERENISEMEKKQLSEVLTSLEKKLNITFDRSASIPKQLWRIGNNLASSYTDGEYLTVHTTAVKCPGFKFKRELWDEAVGMPFENIYIPVPNGYDEILKTIYGNYSVRIPGATDHDYPFYNKQIDLLKKRLGE